MRLIGFWAKLSSTVVLFFSEMNHPKTQQDANFDLEQQFILRMPDDAARYLAEDIDVGIAFKVSFLRCVMRHIYGSR